MKKIIALFTVLAVLFVVVPTFAKSYQYKCGACYGSGKCRTCQGRGHTVVYNWRRDDKGRRIRVPPFQKTCNNCFGRKICKYCNGKGKRQGYIPD